MKYDDDDDRKLIFFRFKLILMLIGPWIPVFFRWDTGTTYIFDELPTGTDAYNAADPNKMYDFNEMFYLMFRTYT